MNHIIVRESSAEIRAIARGALKGNWPVVILTMALYYIFTATVPGILSVLMPSASYSVYNEALGEYLTVSYVARLYDFVLSGAFMVGLCSFMLAFFRRKDSNPAHLFNGFECFFKAFGLMIVQSIFIFLWTLLLFIPGIIAIFRYSQSVFILADHPEKGIMECIRESKQIMSGNKGKLFCLSLSFIGWIILSLMPAVVLTVFLPIPTGILGVLVDFIYTIPYFAVLAYNETAGTAFYELATGHLAVKKPEFNEADYHF